MALVVVLAEVSEVALEVVLEEELAEASVEVMEEELEEASVEVMEVVLAAVLAVALAVVFPPVMAHQANPAHTKSTKRYLGKGWQSSSTFTNPTKNANGDVGLFEIIANLWMS